MNAITVVLALMGPPLAEPAHTGVLESAALAVEPANVRRVASADPKSIVKKVQSTYRAAGDVSAEFSQTFVDKLRGERPAESGMLWAKQDGRVRWSYRTPVPKDFIYTGRSAYFYEPHNSQVTVFEKFDDSPLANALRFLWGQGSIMQTFTVSQCTSKCLDADNDGDLSVLLTPRDPIPSVEAIQLTVDKESGRVARSVVFDPLGNRTEYRFQAVTFNAAIEDKKFAFRIPPGVDILKATADQ